MAVESARSVLVSKVLDDLGYSQEMVKFRRWCWKKNEILNREGYHFIAGSKGEGLTKIAESDTDFLVANFSFLCTSRNPALYNNTTCKCVCRLDRENIAPGYTMLIIDNPIGLNLLDEWSTETVRYEAFLSSERCREILKELNDKVLTIYPDFLQVVHLPAQGPSQPNSSEVTGIYVDQVIGFICDCPEILEAWLSRRRSYAWPPAQTIAEIRKMRAHVVPVGFKGSPTAFLEWRICFTEAEMRLMQGLNDCQIKLIILLKAIAKETLKPICKEMTTYVMKNAVLWVAEIYPPEFFTEQNLLFSLQAALRFLKECLKARNLPSYMIPERNLLIHVNAQGNRSAWAKLCDVIDVLLQEGPSVFVRCEKIRSALILRQSSTEEYNLFVNKSRILEITFMLWMLCEDTDELDEYVRKQLINLLITVHYAILCPDMKKLLHLSEYERCREACKRFKYFLS